MAIPSLIIKRVSGGDYLISDLGIVVPNASQTEITGLLAIRNALCSVNLYSAAESEALKLNDGTRDIPVAEISCFMRRFDTGHVDDVAAYTDLPETGVERQIYLVAGEYATYMWNGSGWTQTCIDQKRVDGIVVSKFGSSAPTEYKHPSGAAISTYERFQSGKDNPAGAGFAGASREWIAGDGGDGGGGDYDGGAAGDLLVRPGAGGALAGAGSAGAMGNFVVWDGVTQFFKVRRDGLTTIQRTDLKAVSTDGLVLENPTPSDIVNTVQMGPRLRIRSNVWDTGANRTDDWIMESLPSSAATPTGMLKFGWSLDGAAYIYRMTLSSAGYCTVSTMDATTRLTSNNIRARADDTTLEVQSRAFTAADSAIEAVSGSMSQGDGETLIGLHIRPTYAQSGTASGVDFLVSRKENSVGTGPQLLADLGTCTTAGDYSMHSSVFIMQTDGTMIVRQPGGTPGTDEIQVHHSGTDAYIIAKSGGWRMTAGGKSFVWSGSAMYPSAPGNLEDVGLSSNVWRAVYAGQGASSGVYLGLSQEANLWYDNGNSRTEFTSSNMFTINAEFNMRSGKKLSLGDGGAVTDAGTWYNGGHCYFNLISGDYYFQHNSVTKWAWTSAEVHTLDGYYFSLGSGGYAADWYAKYTGTNCEMKIVAGEWQFFGGASEIYVINSTGQHGWFGVTPVAQQAHIDDASGGATVDAEARTAINSLLAAIENYGLLAAA